ncbi:MAG TPA: hypothetical protein VGZ22_05975, partial [Isosphaeraceae bacterium]|nr:hypothetical protein [Isosphaeraceae bacterium]
MTRPGVETPGYNRPPLRGEESIRLSGAVWDKDIGRGAQTERCATRGVFLFAPTGRTNLAWGFNPRNSISPRWGAARIAVVR